MTEISDLSSITGDGITAEQIHGMIAVLDVQIYNIIAGNGTWGGVDYKEGGPEGHESKPSVMLRELRELRKMYVEALSNPAALSESAVFLLSQWDDPVLADPLL